MDATSQQNKQKNLLSINGVDIEIKEEFVKYAKDNNLTRIMHPAVRRSASTAYIIRSCS